MNALLKSLLSGQIEEKTWSPSGLPIFMTVGRTFTVISNKEISFLIVEFQENKADIRSLNTQYKKITEKACMPVVFSFAEIKSRERDALIRNGIAFVAENDQLYVPFLGSIFLKTKTYSNPTKLNNEKLQPAAQSVLLFLIYRGTEKGVLKSEVAKILGLTPTSITRASRQLLGIDLIREEKTGREIRIIPQYSGRELFEKSKRFLISPVHKTITVRKEDYNIDTVVAGETALAEYGMLNPPRIATYAVEKNMCSLSDYTETNIQWDSDQELINVEIWKYSPLLFSEDNKVDPISLYCSLMGNPDERIQIELENMIEAFKW